MNPYSPPTEKPKSSADDGKVSSEDAGSELGRMAAGGLGSSLRGLMLTVVLLYPIVLVASFYVTWAVAWSFLGHMPRPSLDDPKYISGWVDVFYNITILLMVGFPAALIGGVFWILWLGVRRAFGGLTIASVLGMFVTLWIGAITFLGLDPWRVGEWFMD